MIVKGGFANNKFVCGNLTIIKLPRMAKEVGTSFPVPPQSPRFGGQTTSASKTCCGLQGRRRPDSARRRCRQPTHWSLHCGRSGPLVFTTCLAVQAWAIFVRPAEPSFVARREKDHQPVPEIGRQPDEVSPSVLPVGFARHKSRVAKALQQTQRTAHRQARRDAQRAG